MDVVTNAIKFDAFSKARLIGTLKDKTELENPNSVAQMKDWLSSKGVDTESLDKKAVLDLLKTVPSDIADVLKLRHRLRNTKQWKVQYVPMVVLEECFSSTERIDLVDGLAV